MAMRLLLATALVLSPCVEGGDYGTNLDVQVRLCFRRGVYARFPQLPFGSYSE